MTLAGGIVASNVSSGVERTAHAAPIIGTTARTNRKWLVKDAVTTRCQSPVGTAESAGP
jgi:hypothetical protein